MPPPITFHTQDTLVIASHNQGKIRELMDIFSPLGVKLCSASDFDLSAPEETASDFEGNARIKAVNCAQATGMIALADDSGFEVDALDGAPGIYSARWAGPDKDFTIAIAKVEEQLKGRNAQPPYTAGFVCALCLAHPDGRTATFRGTVRGQVVFPPRGETGFGFDPIFIPEGEKRRFAEMRPEDKHAMSHRARALAQLIEHCFVH